MTKRRAVTIKDIAKRLGLSHPAVSKALTDSKEGTVSISKATRERVRKVAQEMGYRPNSMARLLRSGRSGMIGIIQHQTVDQIATRRLLGVLGALQGTHYRPYIHCLDSRFEGAATDAIDAMLDARVEAVLCIMPHMQQEHFDTLVGSGLPVAVIGPPRGSVRSYFDDRSFAYRALFDHLVKLGARDIALLFGRNSSSANRFLVDVLKDFSTGGRPLTFSKCKDGVRYRQKQGRRGPVIRFSTVSDTEIDNARNLHPDIHFLYLYGYVCMQRLLESGDLPDAILCQTDAVALGAMRACGENNIRVPQDIAVAGFGNEAAASSGLVPVTTVDHPIRELCELAVKDICRRIESGEVETSSGSTILLKGKLIPRLSTLGKKFGKG